MLRLALNKGSLSIEMVIFHSYVKWRVIVDYCWLINGKPKHTPWPQMSNDQLESDCRVARQLKCQHIGNSELPLLSLIEDAQTQEIAMMPMKSQNKCLIKLSEIERQWTWSRSRCFPNVAQSPNPKKALVFPWYPRTLSVGLRPLVLPKVQVWQM